MSDFLRGQYDLLRMRQVMIVQSRGRVLRKQVRYVPGGLVNKLVGRHHGRRRMGWGLNCKRVARSLPFSLAI